MINNERELFDYFYCSYLPAWQRDKKEGWISRYKPNGSPGYLTKDELYNEWLGDDLWTGFRFSSSHDCPTNYAVIDVDNGEDGIYTTPTGIALIQDALYDQLGIEGVVILRSSHSEGLHILIPFSRPHRTWSVAVNVAEALMKSKLILKNGVLEVYPNVKSYNAMYDLIRTPGQQQQWVLFDDLTPFPAYSHRVLIDLINRAMVVNEGVEFNDEDLNQRAKAIRNYRRSVGDIITEDDLQNDVLFNELVTTGWIEGRTTNTVIPVVLGHLMRKGYTGTSELEEEARNILVNHTDFMRIASPSSRKDVLKTGGWSKRWSRSLKGIKSKPGTKSKHQLNREERVKLIEQAMSDLRQEKFDSQNKCIERVSELTGISISRLKRGEYLKVVKSVNNLLKLYASG